MTTLPRFFVMAATSEGEGEGEGAFLCVQEKPPSNRPLGFLSFDVSEVFSPRVKFEMEKSGVDDTLVHIRSCYTNKYWVVHDIQGQLWIGASSDKPEEDRTNPACTLFGATYNESGTNKGFHFLSIARNMNVASSDSGLTVVSGSADPATLFPIVDWGTLLILPFRVAFRSVDLDDHFLSARILDKYYNYLPFESGLDIGDPLVANQLFQTSWGNYRIKNEHFGKFWRRSPNWIFADAENNNYSNDTIFSFVDMGDGVFGVLNMGNKQFCGALTADGKKNCLNANYLNISKHAKLRVEEHILKREISDIKYRLPHSRIYDETIQQVSHAFGVNNSPDQDSTFTHKYSSTNSRTSTWTNSISVKFGVKVTFHTVLVPGISKMGVEVSTDFGYTYQWGESQTIVNTQEVSYSVVVPPLTTMKVTLMCSKAACDVPFSYKQRDLLPTGEWITTNKDDGVYKGVNTYNFYFQSEKVARDAQEIVHV